VRGAARQRKLTQVRGNRVDNDNEEGYQKRRRTEASEEKFWIAGE
jgi:hypothetical protein